MGAPGASAGIWLADTNSYNNVITQTTLQGSYYVPTNTNTIDGKAILFFYNKTSLDISNFDVTTDNTPILLGGSTRTGSNDVGGTGGISAGLVLIDVTNSIIENNTFANFTGQSGGSGGSNGGSGGAVYGIYTIESPSNNISSNNISSLTGGKGGTGRRSGGRGGAGGTVSGIYLSSSSSNNIYSNTISSLTGGSGGNRGKYGSIGSAGIDYGFYLASITSCLIYDNLVNTSSPANFLGSNSNDWNTTKTMQTNIVDKSYIGGNYWGKPDGTGYSDTCWDRAGDYMCEKAYTLSTDNIDYLPLTLNSDLELPITTATAIKDDETEYTFDTWTSSTYVNVTLTCSDDRSGCNTTLYCLDTTNTCAPNITYAAPVQISTQGINYIRYRSNDTAGNLETTKNQTIKIESRPDLTLSSADINFSDSSPFEGQLITITATVHNIGDVDAENVTVRFYDGNDTIGEKQIPFISYQSDGTASIEWIADLEGIHPIRVVVDPDNVIAERDEENNEATRTISVGRFVGFGGIIVSGAVSPAECYIGSWITVSGDAIYNTTYAWGSPVAGATTTITIIGDRQWGTYTIRTGDYSKRITAPYEPGNYTIVVTVTDYTFSDSVEMPLTVKELPQGIDLVAYSISFLPSKPVENDTVAITAVIRNIGTVNATNVTVRFYDGVTVIGERMIDFLSGKGSTSVSIDWNATPVGWHSIKVVADPDNTIGELNKGNNARYGSIYVYPPVPDLTPTGISFTNVGICRPVVNQSIVIATVWVKNIGGTGAANITVRFYDGATVIDEKIIPYIAGKGGYGTASVSRNFTTLGTHTIKAVVDPEDNIIEINENNNEYSKGVYVYPALPGLAVSWSDITFSNYRPLVGTVITIHARIRNIGVLDAENVTVRFYDGGTEIGTRNISLISAGSSETVSVTWNATPVGRHWIKVSVDPEDRIGECYEYDNTATRDIYVYRHPGNQYPTY